MPGALSLKDSQGFKIPLQIGDKLTQSLDGTFCLIDHGLLNSRSMEINVSGSGIDRSGNVQNVKLNTAFVQLRSRSCICPKRMPQYPLPSLLETATPATHDNC